MDSVSGRTGQQPEENSAPTSPYDAYKGTELWQHVEKAILDLAANNDIMELTKREHIVGYICKQVQPLIPKVKA